MAAERLRVGILGYGAAGCRRRALIDNHPALVTVAIHDPAGVPDSSGALVSPTFPALLDARLDVLFVCAPPGVAAAATAAGLERGLHVFCEKPPARHPEELDAVEAAQHRHPGLRLMYGFNHRRHRSVRCAKELISSGELGRLVNLRGVYGKSSVAASPAHWRANPELGGGGILLDQGIHMVDLLRWFAGEFEEIRAFIDARTHGLDVEDNAYAVMKSEAGVVALLHSSATEWKHRFSLDVALTGGSLTLDGMLSSTGSYAPERLIVRRRHDTGGRPPEETFQFNEDRSWQEEVETFAEAVLDKRPIEAGSLSDARATLDLVARIYAAAGRSSR